MTPQARANFLKQRQRDEDARKIKASVNKKYKTGTEQEKGTGSETGTGQTAQRQTINRRHIENNRPIYNDIDYDKYDNIITEAKEARKERDDTKKQNVETRKKFNEEKRAQARSKTNIETQGGYAGTSLVVSRIFKSNAVGKVVNKDTQDLEYKKDAEGNDITRQLGFRSSAAKQAFINAAKGSATKPAEVLIKSAMEILSRKNDSELTETEKYAKYLWNELPKIQATKDQDIVLANIARDYGAQASDARQAIKETEKQDLKYRKENMPWEFTAVPKVKGLGNNRYSIEFHGDRSEASGHFIGKIVEKDGKKVLEVYSSTPQSEQIIKERRQDLMQPVTEAKVQEAMLKVQRDDIAEQLNDLREQYKKVEHKDTEDAKNERVRLAKLISPLLNEQKIIREQITEARAEHSKAFVEKNQGVAAIKRSANDTADPVFVSQELPEDFTVSDLEEAVKNSSLQPNMRPTYKKQFEKVRHANLKFYFDDFVINQLPNRNIYEWAKENNVDIGKTNMLNMMYNEGYKIGIDGQVYLPDEELPEHFEPMIGISDKDQEAFRTLAYPEESRVLPADNVAKKQQQFYGKRGRNAEGNNYVSWLGKSVAQMTPEEVAQMDARKALAKEKNASRSSRVSPVGKRGYVDLVKQMAPSKGILNAVQGKINNDDELSNNGGYDNMSLSDLIASQNEDMTSESESLDGLDSLMYGDNDNYYRDVNE